MPEGSPPEDRAPGAVEPVALGIDAATLATLERLRERHGNLVEITQPNGRAAFFVNDAAEVRSLLVRRHGRYRKGPGFERVKMLLGNGLIVSDGATWRRSRTMVQPAFARSAIHRLVPVMEECARQVGRTFAAAADRGKPVNVTQETSRFALELILRSIFGADYERRLLARGTNPFAFLSEDPSRDLRVVMRVRELRELLLEIVAERRTAEAAGPYDFLSVYLEARDKSGRGFTDQELLDELVTLIVAGYETSAGTLNWAWYLLAGNPEVRARLVREAREKIGSPVAFESLADMHYTQALLEETLRLYPPVWLFTRRATEADSIGPYPVAEGTDIYLSPYILHRTPGYWEDPQRFEPGRFGESSPYARGERPYFPFSLGPRRCLGEYFSFLEMKIHMGLLAPQFELQRIDDEPPGLDLGINLRSANDIMLRVSRCAGP